MRCVIFYNPNNQRNIGVLKKLEKTLKKKKVIYDKLCIGDKCRNLAYDFAVSIGGDGTVLRTSHFIVDYNIPLIAIRAGELGFLSSVESSKISRFIEDYLNGRFKVLNRSLIRIQIGNNVYKALNDFVIRPLDFRLFYTDVYSSNELVSSYLADGVILSTPTGSTAYNLSAGGPIVHPHSRVIILTPLSPHTLTHRSIVFPETTNLRITTRQKNKKDRIKVFGIVDGQICVDLNSPVVVSVYEKTLKMIVDVNYNYFEILKTKLNWGERSQ